MWLHVRALDAKRTVVFESGRYLDGRHARRAPRRPTRTTTRSFGSGRRSRKLSPDVATAVPAGRSFHLSLNNVRLKDTRIPPRRW